MISHYFEQDFELFYAEERFEAKADISEELCRSLWTKLHCNDQLYLRSELDDNNSDYERYSSLKICVDFSVVLYFGCYFGKNFYYYSNPHTVLKYLVLKHSFFNYLSAHHDFTFNQRTFVE